MMSWDHERPKTVGYGERPRQRLHNDILDVRSETANPSARKSRANHSTIDVADKEISDLRKLIQTCKDLQNIDLNQAESLYSQLLTETNNQHELDKEETWIEQKTHKAQKVNDLDKVLRVVSDENKHLKEQLEEARKKLNEKDRKTSDLYDQLQDSKDQHQKAEREKHEALSRLSRELGTKLSDNNPAITDLSDPNRATKLAEKYNELYDNEWTDALEKLNDVGLSDEDAVPKLLNVIKECHKWCLSVSNEQIKRLQLTLQHPADKYQTQMQHSEFAKMEMKMLKDVRKLTAPTAISSLYSDFTGSGKRTEHDKLISPYIRKCIEICWLIVVQEPVVTLGPEAMKNNQYDSNIYKDYTNTGTRVSFTVWLPLLLHEGGPLLSKGVVQPIKEPSKKIDKIRNQNRNGQEENNAISTIDYDHKMVDQYSQRTDTYFTKSNRQKQYSVLDNTDNTTNVSHAERNEEAKAPNYHESRKTKDAYNPTNTQNYEQLTIRNQTDQYNKSRYEASSYPIHNEDIIKTAAKVKNAWDVGHDEKHHTTYSAKKSTGASSPREFRQGVKQQTNYGTEVTYDIVYGADNKMYAEYKNSRYDLNDFQRHFGLRNY